MTGVSHAAVAAAVKTVVPATTGEIWNRGVNEYNSNTPKASHSFDIVLGGPTAEHSAIIILCGYEKGGANFSAVPNIKVNSVDAINGITRLVNSGSQQMTIQCKKVGAGLTTIPVLITPDDDLEYLHCRWVYVRSLISDTPYDTDEGSGGVFDVSNTMNFGDDSVSVAYNNGVSGVTPYNWAFYGDLTERSDTTLGNRAHSTADDHNLTETTGANVRSRSVNNGLQDMICANYI